MSAPAEEHHEGAPEWMVSYADMITILMSFFVVMYSIAGTKGNAQQEPVMSAFRKHFGRGSPAASGKFLPRETKTPGEGDGLAKTPQSPDDVAANHGPTGDAPRVTMIRSGEQVTIGGVVLFEEGSAELSAAAEAGLRAMGAELDGKPQKIEIRGHTSARPLPDNSPYHDHWDLAYARCRNVTRFLSSLGIEPRRLRVSVAAQYEPAHSGDDPVELSKNGRVEIFMLNEFTDALNGTAGERAERETNANRDTNHTNPTWEPHL